MGVQEAAETFAGALPWLVLAFVPAASVHRLTRRFALFGCLVLRGACLSLMPRRRLVCARRSCRGRSLNVHRLALGLGDLVGSVAVQSAAPQGRRRSGVVVRARSMDVDVITLDRS
jgi:hypothetical protein